MAENEIYFQIINYIQKNKSYQIKIVILGCLIWGVFDIFSLTMGLLELPPNIIIYDSIKNSTVERILKAEDCSNSNFTLSPIQPGHSLVIDFKIYCNKFLISLMGSFNFVGFFLATILLPFILDNYGRKKPIVVFEFVFSICILLMIITKNIYVIIFLIFCCGFSNLISHIAIYMLVGEITDKSVRATYFIFIFNAYDFFGILFTLEYYFINDWKLIFLINVIIGFVLALFCMYFIKESPRFLLINKDKVFIKSMISKLEMHDKKALLPIKEKSSDSNSIYRKIVESSEQIIIKDELEIIENLNTLGEIVQTDINKTKSIFDFILNKSDDKRNFFILCIIWFFTSSTFYSILISIKNLAGNVYLITIIIFMLQIFCNLGSAQMMNNKNLSRVRSINILEACCVLTLLCLIIFSNIPLAKITFVVCLRLFVAMIYCIIYICSVEFYPTEFRATCLSVNSICGRLGASIIPFFIEYLGDYYYVYCLSVFILCFILSFFLTEKNYLEEEI